MEIIVTKRLGEVLELVKQDFSNQEISEKLFVGVMAVKNYMKILYGLAWLTEETDHTKKRRMLKNVTFTIRKR